MLRRAFGVQLTPEQLAAVVKKFDTTGKTLVNTKDFLIYFSKVGIELRQRDKLAVIAKQKAAEERAARRKEHKKKILNQKLELHVDGDFRATDRTSAYTKLTEAAAKYDKNGPGAGTELVLS